MCYNSELAYINVPNPLTLNLGINRPEGNAWEGDFRQFNLSKYLDSQPQLDSTDWLDVILFAKMQPVSDHTKDIDDFCRANPQVAKRLGLVTNFFSFGTNVERRKKIIDNWSIFIQLWNYAGEKGIAEFLAKDVKEFEISVTTTRQLLLRRQSKLLQDWSATLEVDEAYLRALGQVYYRYGDQGLTLMLTKLRQIDLQLGHDFFKVFSQSVLTQSKNFNCFMHESFFTSMDNMIAVLKKSSTKGALLAWQSLLTRHMKAVGWDNIDGLWRGFSHFVNEIEQLGLALDGSEFDAVNPENMLVCMDRILASLNHIPDAAMQQQFLQRLGSMDRTHGGVLYALQSEHFKYFDDALQLHDFTEGTPTYAPDLKGIFSWDSKDAELRMRRVLASQGQFSHAAYPILSSRLANADLSSKHLLMWFLHTQYSAADISSVIGQVEALSLDVQESIAKHLHRAVYHLGNKYLVIQLDAVAAFAQYCESHAVSLDDLLRQYPHGTVLEAFSLLHQSGRWNDQTVGDLVLLFQSGLSSSPGYPDYLYRESYKLAALFGVKTSRSLNLFYDETKNAKPVVQNELRLLITQLLSIDFATSTFESGNISALWADLLQAIEKMKADPANTAQHRVDLIETLNQNGWQIK